MVTQSSVSNYIHTKISFDSGTKVAVVTQYRISYYFHATVSFNCGTKVAVVTRYQLPNYFHITIYPLTPLHKSSPPPSAFQFLFLHKPSIEVTKVTESQNSNYIHTTCHVYADNFIYNIIFLYCIELLLELMFLGGFCMNAFIDSGYLDFEVVGMMGNICKSVLANQSVLSALKM